MSSRWVCSIQPDTAGRNKELLCSICMQVFTDPVTIPCKHNFCKSCLTQYWEKCQHYPVRKEKFTKRPELINTTLRPVADIFKKKSGPDKLEVLCDSCFGEKMKALKSCLDCRVTLCKTHLGPHYNMPKLKKHKLINPVENLEDYICQKHERPLELFCRDDQMCVCQFCTETDHKNHNTVYIEEGSRERKTQLGKTQTDVQKMIQDRMKKIQEIKHSVKAQQSVYKSIEEILQVILSFSPNPCPLDLILFIKSQELLPCIITILIGSITSGNRSTEKEKADSVEVFTALIRSIERSQAELLEVMEQKQKAAERQAEGLIKELEQEITVLKRRYTEPEQLSNTEEHLHLLQIYSSMCSPPHTKNWTEISINTNLIEDTLSQLNEKIAKSLNDKLKETISKELKRIRQYADKKIDSSMCSPPHTKNWTEISINTYLSGDTVRTALSQLQQTLNKKITKTLVDNLKEIVSCDSSSLLSEEQLQCSIFLDVFTDPVTTSCGHNFCKSCITQCWEKRQHYHCPLCNEQFTKKPELKINTTLREVADLFKKKCGSDKPEVLCDSCTGEKLKALKSCLDCGLTFCKRST
ncbi:hypothetical protein QTP70_032180 [Hemibagrus guttatus]|uniref:Uncharacterized protein n=1 Tax=Hemibagrus guttatus TaxID=175788 RepID=A0AAE0R8M0_9TELE|nr:hypothetical protein QTP70_032180 [Hemibagrus guttatus]